MTKTICLQLGCAPGDITCLTALPRDIALTYPDKYEVHVATHCKTLWQHNPYVAGIHAKGKTPKGIHVLQMDYKRYIPQANVHQLHFVTAFHRRFQRMIRSPVPCLHPKGDLHLDEWHYKNPPIEGRYWIVVTGGKSDFTAKIWSAHRWQETIYALKERGLKLVQCGAKHSGHRQPPMDGVLDMVGKTDLREVMWLIYHADGVICPITCFMHMAGAMDRPCVVIAGGREHWWWEAYANVAGVQNFGPYAAPVKVPHRFLHTQGLLDCCKERGCWKNKVLKTQKDKHKSYCKRPTTDGFEQTIPSCLEMISTEHVVEAAMSYYKDGTLPAIAAPKDIVLPTAPAPPVAPVPTASVDLFAPAAQILQTAAAKPAADVPATLYAFKGDQGADATQKGDPFDNPIIGGRLTICVLMYGDYPQMHRACIGNIMKTSAPHRRQLRVACNAVCMETLAFLEKLKQEGHIHTLIVNATNQKKYPVMRQLFHDPDNPIEDNWIVWFDDDSMANRDPWWYTKLAHTIANGYDQGMRMFGDKRFWSFNPTQMAWVKSRPWYHGRRFQAKNGKESPNGNKVHFAAGGFWALETATMRRAEIPDVEIGHNGGDYMVGAQVWQSGASVKAWNSRKQFVFTSSVGRRGLHEIHTAAPGWIPGGISKKRQS